MSNKVLTTYRKNLLALDAALDAAGGPALRSVLDSEMSASDLLEKLAEKGIELTARAIAGTVPEQS